MAVPAVVGYIAATIPAAIDRVSGLTLFHVAAHETGDALQWAAIAEFNNVIDPWVFAQTDILIPPIWPPGTQTGILGG